MPQLLSDDLAACRQTLRGGSRTFFAASHLLPRSVSEPASALYAFCRLADDDIDCAHGGDDRVDQLRDRLDRAYRGQPLPIPADRALAGIVAQFAIPRELPEALLEGLAWDAQGRTYETIEELADYAVRVAGTVGAMMTVIMRSREPTVVARACDLGVAMQFTNIARDVGEDARAGRLYLPRAWMREAGLDPDAWLANPVFDRRLAGVTARLLRAADALYARSESGIARLPILCRPGIRAARILYAEIGREVERRGLDSVSARAVVPTRRKLALLAYAMATWVMPRWESAVPALAQAQFLIDSIVASDPTRRESAPAFGERVVGLIDLFDRLARSDPAPARASANTLGRQRRNLRGA